MVHLGTNLLANNHLIGVISVYGCHQLSIEANAFTIVPGPSPASEAAAKNDMSHDSSRQLKLRLSDLGWENVPSNIADWSQVASIDLTSNPLECDCKLLWLKDLLSAIEASTEATEAAAIEAVANNDTQDSASKVYCQHPYSLRGRPLQVRILHHITYSFIHSFLIIEIRC